MIAPKKAAAIRQVSCVQLLWCRKDRTYMFKKQQGMFFGWNEFTVTSSFSSTFFV